MKQSKGLKNDRKEGRNYENTQGWTLKRKTEGNPQGEVMMKKIKWEGRDVAK